MSLELANPDPRYSKVHLIEPAPLGYLHLAAASLSGASMHW